MTAEDRTEPVRCPHLGECRWCGDDIPLSRSFYEQDDEDFCSARCEDAYEAWEADQRQREDEAERQANSA